jgi:hypothetical protein
MSDKAQIRDLVESWALYRDAGDWAAFASVWHPDGWMTATWFQGPAAEFIAASRAGFEAGVDILHFLGGHTARVVGDRAVAQTKMTIQQRAVLDDLPVEVTCTGRFYDFLARRDDDWGIVRRQPIYEKDRLDVLVPGTPLALDEALLAAYPVGYRHLAYLQRRLGNTVMRGLPGLRGDAVDLLYREGERWLAGSPTAGTPPTADLARA